jgi:NAD(P)-dependent dehydrogenase (short-subunit alcohol dehydrogenase family)
MVILADLDEEAAARTAAQIRAADGQTTSIACDVQDEAQVAAAIDLAIQCYGRLDILHNNAAAMGLVPDDKDIRLATAAHWDMTMAVNLRGQMFGCKHAIPHMLASGRGSIINTSSASGVSGELLSTAYGASKAAINQLTRAIATQYGRHGVRCNAVVPGLIKVDRPPGRGLPDKVRQTLKRHQLLPYPGEANDVANAVAFLASDDAKFITGHLLVVDGGLTAHHPYYADMLDVLEGG